MLSSPSSPLQVLGGTFGTLVEGFGSAGIVIILVVFFLIRREDLRDRFIRLVGMGQVTLTTQMLQDAATRVSRFLSMLFVINASFGIVVGIGLYLIGVPNAILWGILAATLRFVPYIGQAIAAVPPLCMAMAISTGWLAPFLTLGLFVVLGLFFGSVLEPWLYGKGTGVSAVAVLVAAGLDMVVGNCRTSACDAVDCVSLGDRQAHSPTVLLGYSVGKRASIRAHATGLSTTSGRGSGRGDRIGRQRSCEQIAGRGLRHAAHPGMALAETDWHRGELDEGRHKIILESLKEMIQRDGMRPSRKRLRKMARGGGAPRGNFISFAWPLATRRMKSPE